MGGFECAYLWGVEMKYEYFCGSEGDFYGASDTDLVAMHSFHGLAPMFSKSMPSELTIGYFIKGRREPITEPVWDGEGLPPVGVECEIKRVSDWIPVTIKFISGYYTVILTRGGTEDVYQTSALQFRHIRSPEDVARDEATKAFNDIGVMNLIHARQIYDAIAAGKIPGVKLEVQSGN